MAVVEGRCGVEGYSGQGSTVELESVAGKIEVRLLHS